MTTDSTQPSPRSRRALLAGAIGGLGVWAASAIGRAAPAEAAAGDPIRMGRLNKASSTATTLQTKTSAAAYLVNQIGAGAAVKGVATSGRAIMGVAGSQGTGVWAYSPNHIGVSADCPNGVGISASGGTLAAEFRGNFRLFGYQDVTPFSFAPPAPGIGARLFSRDNGAGKVQLCVQFPTGALQVIATEP